MSEVCKCSQPKEVPWKDSDLFIIITGANRGIGLGLSQYLMKEFTDPEHRVENITFMFIVRDGEKLKSTIDNVLQLKNSSFTGTVNFVRDESCLIDLSTCSDDQLEKSILSLKKLEKEGLKKSFYLLFHNAASLGEVKVPNGAHIPMDSQVEYFRINYASMASLTSMFLKHLSRSNVEERKLQNFVIVNFTSLWGIVASTHVSQYCSMKAAREMYIKCLAVDQPEICSMNFSPGPVETEMWKKLLTENGSVEAKTMCLEMEKNGQVLTPNYSVSVLFKWLKTLSFVDGVVEHNKNLCLVHEKEAFDFSRGSHFSTEMDANMKTG